MDVYVTEVLYEYVSEQVNVARSAHTVYKQVITGQNSNFPQHVCHVLVSSAAVTAHRIGLYTHS